MILKTSILITFLSISIFAQAELKYRISDIPKPLLTDAKAVIRKSDLTFEISGIDKAVQKEVVAISILNQNGIDLSVLKKVYDKFSTVRKLKATLYDQYGSIIRTGFNTSVFDIAALSGYSLYEDYRVKIYDPKYAAAPFTVEFSSEISYDGLLTYPTWILYEDFNVSVEESKLTVIAPEKLKIRSLQRNLNIPEKVSYENGTTIHEWTVLSLPALRKETYSFPLITISPCIYLAPSDFRIGGYEGNCDTWTNFGLWIKKLGENRTILDEQTILRLKSMVAGESSEMEKVRMLYSYMQNKVRYVSIQVGIGGWQPFDAKTVEKVSYGDCKALANYMKSLLDAVGIKSYYTLAEAGENAPSMIEEFPSNQFNHAILCVPMKSDTVWLECTDQLIPFGFLGTFTDDRKVLLISDAGGTVVKTKEYTLTDNAQIRRATVRIDNMGNAESSISTDYRGIKYDGMVGVLRMDDFDKKKSIKDRIKLAQFDLGNYNYKEGKIGGPSIIEELNINIPDYCSFTSGKIIFKPNVITRISDVPVRNAKRKSPIVIKRSFCETDTITFLLQSYYRSELKPVEFSLKSRFGEYDYKIVFENKKIRYIRSFKLTKGNFPAEDYDSFVDFFNAALTEDNRQIVLDRN